MKITIEFSAIEVLALEAIAGEGAAGLLTDAHAAKAYIGGKREQAAAGSALDRIRYTASLIREGRKARKAEKK